eukprot:12531045-Alexandrium_andersonii.AAC.1
MKLLGKLYFKLRENGRRGVRVLRPSGYLQTFVEAAGATSACKGAKTPGDALKGPKWATSCPR